MPNDPMPRVCSGDGFLVGLREALPPQNLGLWSPGNKAGQGSSSEARCGLVEAMPRKGKRVLEGRCLRRWHESESARRPERGAKKKTKRNKANEMW